MTLTSRSRLLIRFTVLAALAIGIVMLALSSTGSNTVGAQQGTVPDKPTGVVVTATHDSVSLTWDNPADSTITHYQIFRRDRAVHDPGEFVEIDSNTGSAATSYTDANVEPEGSYVYRVKAVNQHGASTWSNFVRADTPAAPTPPPTPTPTPTPLTASFEDEAETHNGADSFTFRIEFSEAISISYKTLRDHSLDVTDGSVTQARRVNGSSSLWEITVEPDSGADVTITLPVTTDCGDQGAVCTSDGRMLSNEVKLTVTGPDAPEPTPTPQPNTPATGAPTISGTVRVGQTLEAFTNGISDADGLDDVAYSYRWLADNADIAGATGKTYTLVAADQGTTITVRVTFDDDANNEESLTSAATASVAAASVPADVQEAPAFAERGYVFDLAENTDGSTNRVSLGTVSATDPEGAALSYNIEGGNSSGLFEIDAASGELFYTGAGEDFEAGAGPFELTVQASDGDLATHTIVVVTVRDVQEAPAFAEQGYAFDLEENSDGSATRVSIGTVAATDQEGAALSYSIEGGNAAGLFEIDAASGELFYTGAGEDFEAGTGPFELTVRASDGDLSMDTAVTVSVTDVQEAPKSVSEPDGEDFSANKSTDGRVAVGDSATGDIGTPRDRDWFAVELVAGGEYRFDLKGSPTGDGTLFDPDLRGIYNNKGRFIRGTTDDDGGTGFNSRETFTPDQDGTYYVAAGGHGREQGTYTLTATLLNAPPAKGIEVADAEATEGLDAQILFRVTLGRAPSEPVTVSYATADGTAVAGEDYEATSGTLTFAAGETEQTVAVTIIDDAVEDNGETFRLVLSGPAGAELADAEATGTILNIDESVSEGGTDLPANTSTSGAVALGGSATGEIASEGDADWFEVELQVGQTYQIDLEGEPTGQEGSLDNPILGGIYDRNGEQIPFYWDSHSGKGANARLYFQPETNGRYYISAIGGWTGSPTGSTDTGTYRLSVSDVTDTEIPASTATAAIVAVGGTATGEIEASGDQNWFRVELVAGTTYLIEQRGINGFLDDPSQIPDGPNGPNRYCSFLRTDGTYYGDWCEDWRGEDLPDHGTLLTPIIRGIRDVDGKLIAGTAQTDLLTLWLHHSSGNESKPYYVGRVEFTPEETETYYIVAGAHIGYTGTYEVSVGERKRVWSATMTVGSSQQAPNLVGWDGIHSLFANDDLTDADFVYENETYEFVVTRFNSDTGELAIAFDATNSGSISDAAVRRLMTLYVDGVAFALGDATYRLSSISTHFLVWENSGLTLAASDAVQLEMWGIE